MEERRKSRKAKAEAKEREEKMIFTEFIKKQLEDKYLLRTVRSKDNGDFIVKSITVDDGPDGLDAVLWGYDKGQLIVIHGWTKLPELVDDIPVIHPEETLLKRIYDAEGVKYNEISVDNLLGHFPIDPEEESKKMREEAEEVEVEKKEKIECTYCGVKFETHQLYHNYIGGPFCSYCIGD
jgi:hypothetical protein